MNEVVSEYNGFGQLIRGYQAHDDSVNLATTPKFEYAYADGSANTIRPTGLTYPNGRVLSYDYGTAGDTDDAAGRIAAIQEGTLYLAHYSYIGQRTFVEVNYTEPDLAYTPVAPGDCYSIESITRPSRAPFTFLLFHNCL